MFTFRVMSFDKFFVGIMKSIMTLLKSTEKMKVNENSEN